MTSSARRYHVEGVAPALCVRLGADVVPDLIGCSCVRQTVVLTVPEGAFTAEVERGHDGTPAIHFTLRRTSCAGRAGGLASAAPADALLDWRAAVTGPATADRLAAVIAAEIASARDTTGNTGNTAAGLPVALVGHAA